MSSIKLALVCLAGVTLLAAQTAAPVPLSGRPQQGGSVTSTQLPIPGTTSSINTLNPSIAVSGPYAGSALSAAQIPFSGKLSLREALQRGLTYNLGTVNSSQLLHQASGQSRVARSALLPNIAASFSDTEQQTDLRATGFQFKIPVPGFTIPTVVGPFNYMDLQASLTQSVANFTSVNNYRATQQTLRADQLALRDARDLIVLGVGGAYLQVIAAKARLDSARAALDTANAIFNRSVEQKGAGTLAQLSVDQNQLQVMMQRQQITTLENDLAKQKINLARMTGLPPIEQYDISDDIPYAPAPALPLETAMARALQQRADLQAAQAQVAAARYARAAALDERLPSATVSGDYGVIGTTPVTSSHGVFTAVATVNIPIWQGGRVAGDVEQADAALAQRQAEVSDTTGQIEAQVREAFLDLQAASDQVALAQKNEQVAHETLDMVRLRFEAGVINNVELVQAQQSVATAEQDYISSVFAHNVAKLTLARALGNAMESLPGYLNLK